MNGTLWCIAGLLISFLAHNCHASNCHCSSIKAADPVSPALSSSQYAKDNLSSLRAVLFAYKDSLAPPKKKNLALKCAVNYCLLLQEIHICPSIRNISRLHHRQQMGVHHGVMYLQHSARYLAGRVCSRWFLRALGGETGLNIPCYRLHLSAQCLPVLGLCQVQGGGKTVMHCLPPTFSSFPCSDTGEVCLAASETVLSSNQPATTIATIISSSVFFFLFIFDVLSQPFFFFLSKWSKSKWYAVF